MSEPQPSLNAAQQQEVRKQVEIVAARLAEGMKLRQYAVDQAVKLWAMPEYRTPVELAAATPDKAATILPAEPMVLARQIYTFLTEPTG